MLPTKGYFRSVSCPFHHDRTCKRSYCHFRHSRRDVQRLTDLSPLTNDTSEPLPSTSTSSNTVQDQAHTPELVASTESYSVHDQTGTSEPVSSTESSSVQDQASTSEPLPSTESNSVLDQAEAQVEIMQSNNEEQTDNNPTPPSSSAEATDKPFSVPAALPVYKPTPIYELHKNKREPHIPVTFNPDSEKIRRKTHIRKKPKLEYVPKSTGGKVPTGDYTPTPSTSAASNSANFYRSSKDPAKHTIGESMEVDESPASPDISSESRLSVPPSSDIPLSDSSFDLTATQEEKMELIVKNPHMMPKELGITSKSLSSTSTSKSSTQEVDYEVNEEAQQNDNKCYDDDDEIDNLDAFIAKEIDLLGQILEADGITSVIETDSNRAEEFSDDADAEGMQVETQNSELGDEKDEREVMPETFKTDSLENSINNTKTVRESEKSQTKCDDKNLEKTESKSKTTDDNKSKRSEHSSSKHRTSDKSHKHHSSSHRSSSSKSSERSHKSSSDKHSTHRSSSHKDDKSDKDSKREQSNKESDKHAKHDKSSRHHKSDEHSRKQESAKDEKSDKHTKNDKSDKHSRKEVLTKDEKLDKHAKTDKSDEHSRTEDSTKDEKSHKHSKNDKSDKNSVKEESTKYEKPHKHSRNDKSSKHDKSDKHSTNDKSDKHSTNDKSDKHSRKDEESNKVEMPHKHSKNDKSSKDEKTHRHTKKDDSQVSRKKSDKVDSSKDSISEKRSRSDSNYESHKKHGKHSHNDKISESSRKHSKKSENHKCINNNNNDEKDVENQEASIKRKRHSSDRHHSSSHHKKPKRSGHESKSRISQDSHMDSDHSSDVEEIIVPVVTISLDSDEESDPVESRESTPDLDTRDMDSEQESEKASVHEQEPEIPTVKTKVRTAHSSGTSNGATNAGALSGANSRPRHPKPPTPSQALLDRFHKTSISTGPVPVPLSEQTAGPKVRIAHVPNVDLLLNSKKEIISGLAARNTGPSNKTKPAASTTSSALKAAPGPTPLIANVPGCSVPVGLRQTYIKKIHEVFSQKFSPDEAKEKTVTAEREIAEFCKTAFAYRNRVVNSLMKIKRDISNASTQMPLDKSREENPLKPHYTYGLPLYDCFIKYIMTDHYNAGIPVEISDHPGCARMKVLYKENRRSFNKHKSICLNCGKPFTVDENNFSIERGCRYHLDSKQRFKKLGGTREFYWACCNQNEPCVFSEYHIRDNVNYERMPGFVKMPPCQRPEAFPGIFALDCEMCYTTEDCELTRVTVVNHERKVVYDTLCKPLSPIIDYCTRFSGVEEEDLVDVTKTLKDVQEDLMRMFNERTILIGHGIGNDLKALKIIHTNIVDTSIVFPHEKSDEFKKKLRDLTREFLNRTIQDGASGHSSAEDALAALDLMIYKIKEDCKVYKPRTMHYGRRDPHCHNQSQTNQCPPIQFPTHQFGTNQIGTIQFPRNHFHLTQFHGNQFHPIQMYPNQFHPIRFYQNPMPFHSYIQFYSAHPHLN